MTIRSLTLSLAALAVVTSMNGSDNDSLMRATCADRN